MFILKNVFNIYVLSMFFVLSGCGAKHEESDQVDLDAEVLTLTAKVSQACELIAKQTTSPNFDSLDLSQFCTKEKSPAGLSDGSQIGFSTLSDKAMSFENGDKVRSINTQSEVWLNKSMVNLVTKFKTLLAKKEEEVEQPKDVKKKTLDLEILEKVQLDRKNMRVTLKVHVESLRQKNGFLNVSNDLVITAQLMEGRYIAVTAESIGVTPVESSLFRSIKAAVLVVPHASDMYLAIITRIDLHSYGDGVDKKTKNIILGVVQDALKRIPEVLGELDP